VGGPLRPGPGQSRQAGQRGLQDAGERRDGAAEQAWQVVALDMEGTLGGGPVGVSQDGRGKRLKLTFNYLG
jgi:hypothetical protein